MWHVPAQFFSGGPFSHCLGIADELLQTPDELLEANARKVKRMCLVELKFISNQGRFMPNKASKLWGLINSMADVTLGDTQLVESINSLIRLIGNRCPRIDLPGMSARVTVKKSVLPIQSSLKASAKRWSSVREHAAPLLQELLQSGDAFKHVLSQTDRFSIVDPVTCEQLHPSLTNTDFRKAAPVQGDIQALHWAHQHAINWRRNTERIPKNSKNDDIVDSHSKLRRAISMYAMFRHWRGEGEDADTGLAYVHAASHRSVVSAAIMTIDVSWYIFLDF